MWQDSVYYMPINYSYYYYQNGASTTQQRHQESLTSLRLGIEDPDKKDLMSVRASLGLCRGTSWPAPLTDTKVSPAYSWVHPPTCSSIGLIKIHKSTYLKMKKKIKKTKSKQKNLSENVISIFNMVMKFVIDTRRTEQQNRVQFQVFIAAKL